MARNQVIVSVTANTKGLQKGLKDSEGIIGKLGSVAGVATKAVAGIGLALVGVAAAGGVSRALKLDDANTKLKALNYNTEQMEKITQSALASVKGTAFGLDSAVNSAVGLLAAGVKPGQDLTRVLTTISNSAALAGTSMDDMGAIFNKVYANGKVGTEELNQLADRGVPIWQYLSESLNVSTEELRKMVSAGEVTAEMFEGALGPALEGVAGTMGSSFKGMVSNAGAALSRLGAMFAAPLIESSKSGLAEFMTLIDGIASRLQPVIDKFTGFLDGFSFEGLADRLLAGLDDLSGLSPANLVLKLVTGIARGITANADKVTDAVVAMVGNMVNVLGDSIPVILQAAVILLSALIEAIPIIIPGLVNGLLALLPSVLDTVLSMLPLLLEAAITLFQSLVEAVVVIVPSLITTLVELLPVLVESILSMLPGILEGAIELFTALVEAIPVILPLLLKAVIDLLPQIVKSLLSMIPALIRGAVDLFIALVTAVPKILPDLIPAIIGLLPEIIGALLGMIPALIQAGIDLIGGLVSGLFRAAGEVGKALLKIIGDAIGGFLSFLGIASPSKVFSGYGQDLVAGLVKGLDGSKRLVAKSMDGLSNMVTGGFDAALTAPELSLAVSGGSSAAPVGNVYNIELHTLNPTAETGRMIVQSIRDYELAGGRL